MPENPKNQLKGVFLLTLVVLSLGVAAAGALLWLGVSLGDVVSAVSGPSDVIADAPPGDPLTERPVLLLTLKGQLADPQAEVSGLTWAGDTLLLLPQYPEKFGEGGGAIFGLERAAIAAAVDSGAPLTPRPIPLLGDVPNDGDRYEGFEAIATWGDRVWLTIERTLGSPAEPAGDLVWGILTEEGIRIEGKSTIPSQAVISNKAYEALIAPPQGPIALHEINDGVHSPKPRAMVYNAGGRRVGELPTPKLSYRLTDATGLDLEGRFWVINYLWPGDRELVLEREALRTKYNVGPTHAKSPQVERLVQLQYKRDGDATSIERVDRAPVYLRLGDAPRNWEGIAWWGPDAVLMITDEHPGTLLGVVKLKP